MTEEEKRAAFAKAVMEKYKNGELTPEQVARVQANLPALQKYTAPSAGPSTLEGYKKVGDKWIPEDYTGTHITDDGVSSGYGRYIELNDGSKVYADFNTSQSQFADYLAQPKNLSSEAHMRAGTYRNGAEHGINRETGGQAGTTGYYYNDPTSPEINGPENPAPQPTSPRRVPNSTGTGWRVDPSTDDSGRVVDPGKVQGPSLSSLLSAVAGNIGSASPYTAAPRTPTNYGDMSQYNKADLIPGTTATFAPMVRPASNAGMGFGGSADPNQWMNAIQQRFPRNGG